MLIPAARNGRGRASRYVRLARASALACVGVLQGRRAKRRRRATRNNGTAAVRADATPGPQKARDPRRNAHPSGTAGYGNRIPERDQPPSFGQTSHSSSAVNQAPLNNPDRVSRRRPVALGEQDLRRRLRRQARDRPAQVRSAELPAAARWRVAALRLSAPAAHRRRHGAGHILLGPSATRPPSRPTVRGRRSWPPRRARPAWPTGSPRAPGA